LFLYNHPTARFLFSWKVEYTVNKLKIDLSKDGLDAVFAPWQIKVLEILSEKAATGGEDTSFTLTQELNKRLSDGGMSRASVIGFIDDLANWGLIEVVEGHKQGGKYGIYRFTRSMEQVERFMVEVVESWLKTLRHSSEQSAKEEKQ